MGGKSLLRITLSVVLFVQGIQVSHLADARELTQGSSEQEPSTPSLTSLFDYYPPSDLAKVQSSYQGPDSRIVIAIQDLHAHYGVQKKISQLLDFYAQKGISPEFIAVEGAQGLVDTGLLALFPDEKIKQQVSEEFMQKGVLTGMDDFAIRHSKADLLWGVDDQKKYDIHLKFFQDTLAERSHVATKLQALQERLEALEPKVYSQPMLKLQKKIQAYEKGKMPLAKYLNLLADLAKDSQIQTPHDVEQMADLVTLEKSGQKPQFLKKQTQQLLTILYPTLTKQESDHLAQYAQTNSTVYYLYLHTLAKRHRAWDTAPKPLRKFLQYTHGLQSVDMQKFQTQLENLTHRLLLAQAKTQTQKNLVQAQRDLRLLMDLVQYKLTEDSLKDVLQRSESLFAFVQTMVPEDLNELLTESIDFYAFALMRDKPMVEQTLQKLRDSWIVVRGSNHESRNPNPAVAVLVTGGFHTSGIARLLKEKGVSYLVVSPNVESYTEADQERYIERLMGQMPDDEYAVKDTLQLALKPIKRFLPGLAAAIERKVEGMLPATGGNIPLAVKKIEGEVEASLKPYGVNVEWDEAEQDVDVSIPGAKFEIPVSQIGQKRPSAAPILTRRRFLGGALALTTSILTACGITPPLPNQREPSVPLPPQKKPEDTAPGKPDEEAAQRFASIYKFLATNRTNSTNMPLSYKAPNDYWKQIRHPANNPSAVMERLLTKYSLNIYDGGVGQIAEMILGHTQLADEHTQRLASGSSGELGTIRARSPFVYNGKRPTFDDDVGANEIPWDNTWFFRMISDQYLQPDPLDDKMVLRGFPTSERLHHEDWKPIAGENAWAPIIGPLQVAFAKYQGKILFDSLEVKLALSVVPAIEAMQSAIGGIFHAPAGTFEKSPNDISNENNLSMLAAVRTLKQVLESLPGVGAAMEAVKVLQKIQSGILDYMKNHMLNKDSLDGQNRIKSDGIIFDQGGFLTDGIFRHTTTLAVDVQTWGILVLGPEQIDEWYGEGAAYHIWKNTKRRGGYYEGGILEGVGFTDGNDINSAEWGFGAIMAARALARHYEKTHSDWAQECLQDSQTMRAGIEKLKVTLEDGSVAYKYSNKRVWIPFGWWANPIPSLAATAWSILVDTDFNPFVLGGGPHFRRPPKVPDIKKEKTGFLWAKRAMAVGMVLIGILLVQALTGPMDTTTAISLAFVALPGLAMPATDDPLMKAIKAPISDSPAQPPSNLMPPDVPKILKHSSKRFRNSGASEIERISAFAALFKQA